MPRSILPAAQADRGRPPEVDAARAHKKLRRFVEGHAEAIRQKAEIMVDHFHDEVIAKRKVGGQAKAMVVTAGIERAIQYRLAFDAILAERRSPWKALVAFTGEKEYHGARFTEDGMNGFPGVRIPEEFEKDEFRFLIVAEKFQTGFDQPKLHTMYVDKELAGVQAVQTLSRLNRTMPGVKHDTFILDFHNDAERIREGFEPYYRTTLLSEETDPNKLHDLKADLDGAQVYGWQDVETFVSKFLAGTGRYDLDLLSNIIKSFNEQFGGIFTDAEDGKNTLQSLGRKISEDESFRFRNARASGQNKQTIRIAHDEALKKAMLGLIREHTDLYRLYSQDHDFKRALAEALFRLALGDEAA